MLDGLFYYNYKTAERINMKVDFVKEEIENSKLKIIINRVIERDKITLKNLIMIGEDTN